MTPETSTESVAADQLKSFIDRIERVAEEKDQLSVDSKEIYAEAKSFGFDTAVIRQIIKLRKQDKAEREHREAILELYMSALGEAQ